jgi:hypothetical protein
MLSAVIGEGVAIALLVLLVAGLLRSHADILRALHDLGVDLDPDRRGARPARGTLPDQRPAADLTGTLLDGSAAVVAVAGTSHDTLLVFLSGSCATCRPFWTALADSPEGPDGARVVVVVQDGDDLAPIGELARDLEVVVSSAAWIGYGVPGSPHVVQVDGPSGRVVGEGTGQSWPQVLDMLRVSSAARVSDRRSGAGNDDRVDSGARVDRDLAAAGIGPGHPSLYVAEDGTDEG